MLNSGFEESKSREKLFAEKFHRSLFFFEVLKITENISMIFFFFLPFNPSFRLRRGSPLSFRVWRREKDRIN